MYSSNVCTVSPNQQFDPTLPTYQSNTTRSESSTPPSSAAGVVPGSPYQTTVTPDSSYSSPPHYSLSGTVTNNNLVNSIPNIHCPNDLSPHTLDQFEFNDAAEFLSLDQPINKELPAPACATINRKPSISSSDVTKGATSDLSSLLGLPSISSFLDEGEEENPANEHIDKILGLSLNLWWKQSRISQIHHRLSITSLQQWSEGSIREFSPLTMQGTYTPVSHWVTATES